MSSVRSNNGFTLLELMIVAAIIAILAGIAFPSYLDSVQKSRRSDAYESLLDCASAQARYFTRITPSSYLSPATAQTETLCGWNGTSFISKEGYYSLVITNPSCTETVGTQNVFSCFLLTATHEGAQASDVTCETFTVDERGNRAAEDDSGGDTTDLCWKN